MYTDFEINLDMAVHFQKNKGFEVNRLNVICAIEFVPLYIINLEFV